MDKSKSMFLPIPLIGSQPAAKLMSVNVSSDFVKFTASNGFNDTGPFVKSNVNSFPVAIGCGAATGAACSSFLPNKFPQNGMLLGTHPPFLKSLGALELGLNSE